MPQVNPDCFHQSASSIGAFKKCPTLWRLLYREGLRPADDTESQRVGTNWHAMHETYANALSGPFNAEVTGGADPTPQREYGLGKVVEHLNQRYATMPTNKTAFEWGMERQILLTCFIGYLWYWQEDQMTFLHSELPFELPIHAPKVGLPLPMSQVLRLGKIDHIIKWQDMVGALERKSTTRSIAPDSDYWDKGKKDTQVSMYALAMRDMLESGNFPVQLEEGANIGNTLYDVWHRPTIKPKMLTQADTKIFCDTGMYLDQKYEVSITEEDDAANPPAKKYGVSVDGEAVEVEMGKKGFAIKESIAMYGARLLADIYERPDFYFARREIVRTDAELRKFRGTLYSIYQCQKTMADTGHFYEDESQCRATFPCPMIPICYGPGADAVCDGKTTPNGFKRIFVDLMVNGEVLDAE